LYFAASCFTAVFRDSSYLVGKRSCGQSTGDQASSTRLFLAKEGENGPNHKHYLVCGQAWRYHSQHQKATIPTKELGMSFATRKKKEEFHQV